MFCLVMSVKMGNLPQSPWENQAKCANTGTVVSACECHYHGLQKKKEINFILLYLFHRKTSTCRWINHN